MENLIIQTQEKINTILENVVKDKDLFEKYLNLSSRLYNFSYYNLLMIYQQYPNAATIAGFNTWLNTFDSQIKDGEKPIYILIPTIKDTEVQYVIQPVFDIKQTTCQIDNFYNINEAVEYILPSLKQISGIDFIPAEKDKVSTYLNNLITNEIFYNNSLPEKETAIMLIKAYINTLSDDKIMNNYISYVVLKHFNLPIGNISFVFLNNIQSKTIEDKREYLNDIQRISCNLIESLKTAIESKIKYTQIVNQKSFLKR